MAAINIMVCPITQGDHNNTIKTEQSSLSLSRSRATVTRSIHSIHAEVHKAFYRSSAVAEMGIPLATTDLSRKVGGCYTPIRGGAGSPSNTMSPGPRPTFVPSGILIHPTVWLQYTLQYTFNMLPNIYDNRQYNTERVENMPELRSQNKRVRMHALFNINIHVKHN